MMNITYTLCDASYDDMIMIFDHIFSTDLLSANLKRQYYYRKLKHLIKKMKTTLPKQDVKFTSTFYPGQVGSMTLGTFSDREIHAHFDIDRINSFIVKKNLPFFRCKLNDIDNILVSNSDNYANLPLKNTYSFPYPPLAVQAFYDNGSMVLIDGNHRVNNAREKKENIEVVLISFADITPECFCSLYDYILYLK